MSNNTATFVFQTREGFRVFWGNSDIIQNLRNRIDINLQKFLMTVPFFLTKEDAIEYATIIDIANRTEFGIMYLDHHKLESINDII